MTAYYCFLNATKALLTVRGETFSDRHGVHGENEPGKRSLQAEKVNFQGQGVLGALCHLCGEDSNPAQYSLKETLYNLPFIHRAYTLTYRSVTPLFIPLRNPRFVRKTGSTETWFCAELEPRYHNRHTDGKLPDGWEIDVGAPMPGTIRRKARFKWKVRGDQRGNLERLTNYHREIRKQLFYIVGPMRLWYLKRGDTGQACIPRSSLTLTFAAMHRLSELSRYDPLSLTKHLDRDHNWLQGLTQLATANGDFDRVGGMTIYKPTDLEGQDTPENLSV